MSFRIAEKSVIVQRLTGLAGIDCFKVTFRGKNKSCYKSIRKDFELHPSGWEESSHMTGHTQRFPITWNLDTLVEEVRTEF